MGPTLSRRLPTLGSEAEQMSCRLRLLQAKASGDRIDYEQYCTVGREPTAAELVEAEAWATRLEAGRSDVATLVGLSIALCGALWCASFVSGVLAHLGPLS